MRESDKKVREAEKGREKGTERETDTETAELNDIHINTEIERERKREILEHNNRDTE